MQFQSHNAKGRGNLNVAGRCAVPLGLSRRGWKAASSPLAGGYNFGNIGRFWNSNRPKRRVRGIGWIFATQTARQLVWQLPRHLARGDRVDRPGWRSCWPSLANLENLNLAGPVLGPIESIFASQRAGESAREPGRRLAGEDRVDRPTGRRWWVVWDCGDLPHSKFGARCPGSIEPMVAKQTAGKHSGRPSRGLAGEDRFDRPRGPRR